MKRRPMTRACVWVAVLAVCACARGTPTPSPPAPPAPRASVPPADPEPDLPENERRAASLLKNYFAADGSHRATIARDIAADPAYAPEKLSTWLHRCGLYGEVPPKTREIDVSLDQGETRQVALRLPPNYTPARRWPLILAYHYTGGSGDEIVAMVASRLGPAANRYIIAGPSDYLPLNIDSRRAWRPEPRLVLRHLRRLLHIDGDRVYVTGHSQGGYAAWSYATFYGDELAGAAPAACTFDAAPELPGLWEALLPNCANVPVLFTWGGDDRLDVLGLDLKTVAGHANDLNRRLNALLKKLDLPNVVSHEIPHGGHAYAPPRDALTDLFERKRSRWPEKIRHRYRYLVQGRAFWLEPLSWDGNQWGLGPIHAEPGPGETREQLAGRVLVDRLAELAGDRAGNEFRVTHRHVGEFVLWFGEGMIDWNRPVHVSVNGRVAYDGPLQRDLAVCLAQAARTNDFDRLRWAGLRVSKDGGSHVVTERDEFPDVVWGKPK